MLGYGLSDLTPEDRSDPRINWDAQMFDYSVSTDDYKAWMKARIPEDEDERIKIFDTLPSLDLWWANDQTDKHEGRRNRTIDDTWAYDPEFGCKEVILFQPISCHDWRRYDDMLDWIEETYFCRAESSQLDHWEPIPHGIYPWNATYMDIRTGERIKDRHGLLMSLVRVQSHLCEEGKEDEPTGGAWDNIARELGLADTYEETMKLVAPFVPQEVRWLCEFLGVFNDPATVNQLRPMIYVWWS
jgi:hypothetical protein